MCAQVGNQQRCGVVTARVQTNAVRSLRHQRQDLHQLTPYLSEDRDSFYYHYQSPLIVVSALTFSPETTD
jgi:hypothetical protein